MTNNPADILLAASDYLEERGLLGLANELRAVHGNAPQEKFLINERVCRACTPDIFGTVIEPQFVQGEMLVNWDYPGVVERVKVGCLRKVPPD